MLKDARQFKQSEDPKKNYDGKYFQISRLLLLSGADINIKNDKCETAFQSCVVQLSTGSTTVEEGVALCCKFLSKYVPVFNEKNGDSDREKLLNCGFSLNDQVLRNTYINFSYNSKNSPPPSLTLLNNVCVYY